MEYPQNLTELFEIIKKEVPDFNSDLVTFLAINQISNELGCLINDAIKKYSEMVKEKIESLKKTNSLTYTRTGNADFTSPDFTIAATGIGTVNDENC